MYWMSHVDMVWFAGPEVNVRASQGMKGEYDYARALGKPTFRVSHDGVRGCIHPFEPAYDWWLHGISTGALQ